MAMLVGLIVAVRPGEMEVAKVTVRWNTVPAIIVIVEVPVAPG
jgi:hypothetical protein